MFEYRNIAIFFVALIVLGGLILAKPDFDSLGKDGVSQVVDVVPSKGHAKVAIPSHATEVAPGVFFLGTAVIEGKMLEGYAIVDYKEGFGKPTGCNYDGKCQGWEDSSCSDCKGSSETETNCYGFLAKGARWRVAEYYLINPTNSRGLNKSYVFANFENNIKKWENAAGTNVVDAGSSVNITLSADMSSPDGKNEVYFGEIADRNAIAVTIVWGVFRGPPGYRELVEWDMVFDQEDFGWSPSGEAGKMDFESIATHELGHVIGLDDLYDTKCSDETMYGYADYGETKKRTLEAGDKKGALELYS